MLIVGLGGAGMGILGVAVSSLGCLLGLINALNCNDIYARMVLFTSLKFWLYGSI